MVFTPLAFAFDLPALLPIGCGLLSSPVSALPASGGVIIYYFIRYVRIQSQVLMSQDTQMIDKLTLLSDGIMKNGEMWLTLITFVVVILAVQLIRTRQFDYAWRIAIIAGGVIYLVLMLAGSMYFGLSVPIATQIVFTVVAVLLGIVLEFFVFGGDYTRTERLEYEDDDYYYCFRVWFLRNSQRQNRIRPKILQLSKKQIWMISILRKSLRNHLRICN